MRLFWTVVILLFMVLLAQLTLTAEPMNTTTFDSQPLTMPTAGTMIARDGSDLYTCAWLRCPNGNPKANCVKELSRPNEALIERMFDGKGMVFWQCGKPERVKESWIWSVQYADEIPPREVRAK